MIDNGKTIGYQFDFDFIDAIMCVGKTVIISGNDIEYGMFQQTKGIVCAPVGNYFYPRYPIVDSKGDLIRTWTQEMIINYFYKDIE